MVATAFTSVCQMWSQVSLRCRQKTPPHAALLFITAATNKTGLRDVRVAVQTISVPNYWMTWFGVNYAAIYSTLNYS